MHVEPLLTCTHNRCFEQKQEIYIYIAINRKLSLHNESQVFRKVFRKETTHVAIHGHRCTYKSLHCQDFTAQNFICSDYPEHKNLLKKSQKVQFELNDEQRQC